jgi:hypothetical protein
MHDDTLAESALSAITVNVETKRRKRLHLSPPLAQRVLRFIEKQEERPDGFQVCDIANTVGTEATSIEYDFLRFIRFPP